MFPTSSSVWVGSWGRRFAYFLYCLSLTHSLFARVSCGASALTTSFSFLSSPQIAPFMLVYPAYLVYHYLHHHKSPRFVDGEKRSTCIGPDAKMTGFSNRPWWRNTRLFIVPAHLYYVCSSLGHNYTLYPFGFVDLDPIGIDLVAHY